MKNLVQTRVNCPRPRRLLLVACVIPLLALLGTSLPTFISPTSAQSNPIAVQAVNTPPDFLVLDSLVATTYDGVTDDLLTAGLGQDGLASATAPGFVDAANPTPAELRRLAIYTNYRAIVDTSAGGGYGTLYGPAIGTSGDGKIAGKEYLAYASGATGTLSVTMMVQIPASFDPANPCIITGPSSGSRGVYGAIGTAGEWGLKRGCAVAYTDKGTGNGVHDLNTNSVTLINGTRQEATAAAEDSNFTAEFDSAFVEDNPHRLAFKHAHSGQNPEQAWGQHVLQSIVFAFYVLNLPENYGQVDGETVTQTITPENTIVIASSVSNGGGASLRAAEQDTTGLIDGVAVSEPNISPTVNATIVIRQGAREWAAPNHSRALYDYVTLLNVYQPCANLAPGIKDVAPFNNQPSLPAGLFVPEALGEARCASLKAKGLLTGETLEEQAAEAQTIINNSGILTEQNYLQPSHHTFYIPESLAVTYANAYGRFSVTDNLCGFSFAGVNSATLQPAALSTAQLAAIFATSSGIPPTGGVQLINNTDPRGPTLNRQSLSPSNGAADQNLDGALCLRNLATGTDAAGNPLTGAELERYQRVSAGNALVRATGNLQGKPVIIVNGRSDAILPPNHTSRPYYALNQIVEGENSNLHYYEVLNAHHLDAFNSFAGFNSEYIPLHYYFIQAMDLMYAHLKNGTALPASQVINTFPRGTTTDGVTLRAVPALTEANVPPIDTAPPAAHQITFDVAGDNVMFIPNAPGDLYLPITVR